VVDGCLDGESLVEDLLLVPVPYGFLELAEVSSDLRNVRADLGQQLDELRCLDAYILEVALLYF